MKLSFNLTVDDWVAFQEYHRNKKAPLYGWINHIISLTILATFAMGLFMFYHNGFNNNLWISVICILALLYLQYLRKKSKDKIKEAGLELAKKHPEAFGPMNLEFSKDGLYIQSKQTSQTIPWNEMGQFEENKLYFFLYSKKGIVYIIPKRGLSDPNELNRLIKQEQN